MVGSVRIGTADTNYVISGGTDSLNFRTATTDYAYIKGEGIGTADAGGLGVYLGDDAASYFKVNNSASGEIFRITGDGKLGVGTSTPIANLHIYGDGKSMRVTNTAGTMYTSIQQNATTSKIYASASSGLNALEIEGDNYIALTTYSGGYQERVRIAADGDVGIGVTDPGAAKLRVEGNTIVNGNINQLVATSYNYLVAPTSIGSASSPGTHALYVNGLARFDTGVRIEPTSGGWVYYPNVVSYNYDATSPGAIILNTNITRTSNEMFKMRVIGYGYGATSNIDFTVVGYAYSGQNGSVDGLAGAITNYSIVDNGNDGLTKRVGINSSGNVAIAVGDTNSSFYYYRMAADYWSTRNAVAVSSWSFSTSTTAGFGWLDSKNLAPAITEFTDGAVSIGTTTDYAYKLFVNGTSLFNGQLSLAAGQQLTWSATNVNNKIDLAGGDLTGVDKISAATVDPLYEIEGAKYSTYAPSITGGVKEEYIGQAKLKKYTGKFYEYILDLDQEKKGSDLWVWFKTVDFSKDSVQATITPIGEPVSVAYEIKNNSIIFRGSSATEFSFRLTGKRFDWRDHPTYAKDQEEKPNLIIK